VSIDIRRKERDAKKVLAKKKFFFSFFASIADVCFVFITVGEVYQLLLLNRNYLNSSNKTLLSKPSIICAIVEIIFLLFSLRTAVKTLLVINEKVTCSVNK
jgi:hypothetical protein